METIHILQKTYELLYVARKPLIEYLESRLSKVSEYWLDECVYKVIELKKKKKFYELDIYYLIKVLENEDNKRLILSKFPGDKLYFQDGYRKLYDYILELRCNVMHPGFENVSFREFENWKKKIDSFVKIFSPKKPLGILMAELHNEETASLFNMILQKGIEPALENDKISEKTKKHIRNTKNRLKKQQTPAGIIAFFEDALDSVIGKEIAEELEANNLLSFEKIQKELYESYER